MDNDFEQSDELEKEIRNVISQEKKEQLMEDQINDIIKYLMKFPLLLKYINNDLYQQTYLRDIAFHLRYRKIKMGEVFIQQGEKFHNFYLILSGNFSLFSKKTDEQLNQEQTWCKIYTTTLQHINSDQQPSINSQQMQKLKEQAQKAEGLLKVLQTPFDDQKLLLPHSEFYKNHQKICMYTQVEQEFTKYDCLGDIYDTSLSSPHLVIAKQDTEIAYLHHDTYTKLFASSIQQLNFISRALEKILSNGNNKNEIQRMSRLFKEKQANGNIFNENENSKQIFIVKKGIIIIKKGEIKVQEITSGKIFGHENALSEQNRTISAETKGCSLCTLYYVNVNDLAEVVSFNLLKNFMKQGRKKLEQYQEQSFKFNPQTEQKLLNSLKMSKVTNESQCLVNNKSNHLIQEKQGRSQSSHIQNRSSKNISQHNSFQIQNNEKLNQLFQLSYLKQKELEKQQNLKKSEEIMQYMEKYSPKSSQLYLSAPQYQTMHQVQTNGLVITMGNSNQKFQIQNPQRHISDMINPLQQNQLQFSNQSSNNYVKQLTQDGLEYDSSQVDYQPTRNLYTQQAKRSNWIYGVIDQRKIINRKTQETKDIYNSSKTTTTDQSWFVIKRLNNIQKAKQEFIYLNTPQQSNAMSPTSFQDTQANQKEFCSFSKLMTQINNKNNGEEQESPVKQRATLTSFIKIKKNGQNTQKKFESVRNSQSDQIQTNSEYQNFKPLSQSAVQQYLKQNFNQELSDQKGQVQLNPNLEEIARIPNLTIGSVDEDEDRNDFNLESRYTGKQNIIHQQKNSYLQQDLIQNNTVSNNITPLTNIQNLKINNSNIQINNSQLNRLQNNKVQTFSKYSIQNSNSKNINQQNNNISLNNSQTFQNNIISMNTNQNNLIQNTSQQIHATQNYKQQSINIQNLSKQNINKQNSITSNNDQINNLLLEINEHSAFNKRSNSFHNTTTQQNSKYNQLVSNNLLYSTVNQKVEVVPQILFQKRHSSHISYQKAIVDKSNTSNLKQQMINTSQTSQLQKSQNMHNMNQVSTSNVQNIDDLILYQRKSTPQIFNNTMLNQKLEESEDINYLSYSQKKILSEKQSNCSTHEFNNIESSSTRKISFGILSNSSGLTQLKRSHLNSPDIFKVSDFIQDNKVQEDQQTKNKDSDKVKQAYKDSKNGEKRKQSLTLFNTYNLKIKLRTNTSNGTRKLSNAKKEIQDTVK